MQQKCEHVASGRVLGAVPAKGSRKELPWTAGHAIRSRLCSQNTVCRFQISPHFSSILPPIWHHVWHPFSESASKKHLKKKHWKITLKNYQKVTNNERQSDLKNRTFHSLLGAWGPPGRPGVPRATDPQASKSHQKHEKASQKSLKCD